MANDTKARARELRSAGKSISAISAELGVARSTICRWINPKNAVRGECECGCGQPTAVDQNTWRPYRFVRGHHVRRPDAEDYRIDENGCWIWQGSINPKGYGNINRGGHSSAHRWSYEYYKGPIPGGLHLDHLCRVPACINPEHLEPVTNAENVRRRDIALGRVAA